MVTQTLSSDVRDALGLLARSSDRTSPSVFVGREEEIDLIDSAVQMTRRGEVGHTVVVQGVPGAGKTALLREYGRRLLASSGEGGLPVVPVPLRPTDLNASPAAILEEVDRQFCEFETTGKWGEPMSTFAAFTKRDFREFTASARAPNSLPVALDSYMRFRFNRRDSTIVLLVDEAQNLPDTPHVRAHLDALHGGVQGHTQVLLVCFGLRNTTARLRELGLSRLASDHERSIGVLGSEDAKRAVIGTLEAAFSGFVFDDGTVNETRRTHWIGASVDAILRESGNFPHHLANGCRSLARIVLDEGIGVEPPVRRLQEECRKRKRDYYDARLHPWRRHTVALSHAFPGGSTAWTSIEDVVAVLMASDNFGRPVAEDVAVAIVDELSANGFVEEHMTGCRLALPPLESHFKEMHLGVDPRSKASQAVRAVRADLGNQISDSLSK